MVIDHKKTSTYLFGRLFENFIQFCPILIKVSGRHFKKMRVLVTSDKKYGTQT